MNLWAIFGTALSGLLLVVVEWLKQGQAHRAGAALEAGQENAAAAAAETAIAQAVVAAPATQQAVVDRLKAGTF
jgi:hypothetical protein